MDKINLFRATMRYLAFTATAVFTAHLMGDFPIEWLPFASGVACALGCIFGWKDD